MGIPEWKDVFDSLLSHWRCSGQAMIELSIFGAIFLMILAVLVSYGLKYDYMQKAQMETFRTAMKIAADPDQGSATYMKIQDKHVPDAAEALGIGSVAPVVTSASVTRTNEMDALAESAASLSPIVYDVQTTRENGVSAAPQRLVFNNAGWRMEYNLREEGEFGMAAADENRLQKYSMIYGTILGKKGGGWEPINPSGEYDEEKYRPDRTCLTGYWQDGSSGGGEDSVPVWVCTQYVIDQVRIVDPCVGNLSDYTTCYDVARKIVDVNYCTTDCRKTCPYAKNPSDCHTNCADYCNAEMNPPNQKTKAKKGYNMSVGGAWYADYWYCAAGDASCLSPVFPVLNELFRDVSPTTQALGLQTTMTAESMRDASYRKVEKAGSIETTESASWSDATERGFLVNENLITTGVNAGREIVYDDAYKFTDNVNPYEYISVDKGSIDQTWKTEK
ncbi:MAG: hypothetical protein ABIC68_00320 [Candidatus Omnitrophota bacterium]